MQSFHRLRLFISFSFLLAFLTIYASADVQAEVANTSDPLAVALQYIQQNREQYGLTTADIAHYRLTDQYQTSDTQTTHIYLLQQHAGIDAFGATLNINISGDGRVLNMGNRFVPDLANQINSTQAQITAVEAATVAAQHLSLVPTAPITIQKELNSADQAALLSDGGISAQAIPVRLVFQPTEAAGMRLAWNLLIYSLDGQHGWDVRVDAQTGSVLAVDDLAVHDEWGQANGSFNSPAAAVTTCSGGSGNNDYCVYPMPVESPNHTTPTPPGDGRSVATAPWSNALNASPFGWHDTNGVAGAEYTITRGNNVYAYEDGNNPGFSPDGGANLVFNFNIGNVDGDSPNSYEEAAISNLFYWNNIVHDLWYEHGFDEVGGNFQENNYGNGGSGGDSVNAEAQDGSGTCNANMLVPADGGNPTMQMYLCGVRDGDLDNSVIAHEYWHGISNRLTGGPASVNCLGNAEQGGEGWSDWGALMMTIEVGDSGSDSRPIGTWLFGESPTGAGIRSYPYSTDMGVNPQTYDSIQSTGGQAHDVGEVWAGIIWEVSWALIDEYGFNPDFYAQWNTGGNNLAMRLIIDGLKLQPCSPGFVDARDAILAADQALTSGANQCLLWAAFAKRGLGSSAVQGSSSSVTDNSEAFDIPTSCQFLVPTPTTLDVCVGTDAVYNVDVGVGYTSPPVTMSASGNPAGSIVTFSPASVPGPLPGSTTMTVSNLTAATAGNHIITISGDDGVNNQSSDVELNVFPNTLGTATLLTPANGATGVFPNPTLTWTAVSGAASYLVEIDDDPAFGSIDYSGSEVSTSHAVAISLNAVTTYYWRVTAQNICATGPAASTFSFTTANVICTVYPSADVPQAIPGLGTATSTVDVPDAGAITDVNVLNLVGTHTWVGTLEFYLDSPTSSSVQLREQVCGTDSDFDLNYDDEAASAPPCPPTDGGTYQPFGNLSDFDGEASDGTWTLTIDNFFFFTGQLDSWSLEVCYVPAAVAAISVSPASLTSTLLPATQATQTLTINNMGTANLDWMLVEDNSLVGMAEPPAAIHTLAAPNLPACSAAVDIPWLSPAVSNGTTAPSSSSGVDVVFDATGYAAGVYTGTVCVNSNDPLLPQVQLPVTMTVQSVDYSDLPASYGTAGHIGLGDLRLGLTWTADSNFASNNDDASDDGLGRTAGAWVAGNTVTVTVTVKDGVGVDATGYVAGWVDWDDSGDFAAGEQILGQSVAGSQPIGFAVPAGYDPAAVPTLQARFRLYASEPSLLGTETPTGSAVAGEVEDYSWSFGPTAITLRGFRANRPAGAAGWLTALLLLLLTSLFWHRQRTRK